MATHIGTSGWSYDHWVDIVYPRRASSLERLDRYAERFGTVEVNFTYYRWPQDSTFTTWRERAPEGFLFSVKASRGITHFAKLRDPSQWLEKMGRGLEQLGDRMGVLLFQLPAAFPCDLERLESFLEELPDWYRSAIEFRHPSWDREEVYQLLEQYGVGYCVMSGAGLPCVLRATAHFVYVRLHGPDPHHLYGGSYSEEDMRWWAERIAEWEAQGRDVWAYFNNDWEGNAVRNAETLLKEVSLAKTQRRKEEGERGRATDFTDLEAIEERERRVDGREVSGVGKWG